MTIELIKITVEHTICGIVISHRGDKLNNTKRKHNGGKDKKNSNKINVTNKNKMIKEDAKKQRNKIKIHRKDLQYVPQVLIRWIIYNHMEISQT